MLITSPFQLINFKEYSLKFNLSKSFIIVLHNNITSLNQILEVANFFRIEVNSVYEINKILYIKFYFFSLKHKKFDKIILGQYFSNPLTFITNIVKSEKIIYVDDGFQALMIDQNSNININTIIIHLCFLKTLKKHNIYFFSIFNLKSVIDKLILNDYSYIRSLVKYKNISNKIYFIGQPVIELNILSLKEYINVIKKITSKYNSPFIYIAHRREKSINLDVIKSLGIEIIVPTLPIEVFLIKHLEYPKAIIGVSSTALLTISLMFEKIEVFYFYIEKLNKINKFNEIYGYFNKFNVKCFQNS